MIIYEKKTILFVTSSLITGSGGIASYARDFIDALKNIYKICVITGDAYSLKDKDEFKLYNLNIYDFNFKNSKLLLEIIKIEDPSIIINSNSPLLACVLPFLDSNINVISISHFIDGEIAKIASHNYKYVNTIIALSDFGRRYIKKYKRIKSNDLVKIVYNFIAKQEFITTKLEYKKSRKVLKIVYPGGTRLQKSADIVCKMLFILLKTNYEFEFYWIGDSKILQKRYFLLNLYDLAQILPFDQRIKFVGQVSREDAKKIIEDSNIFLLPSRKEGCPISLIEAMSHGSIPVVSDAKHASSEIIINNVSGFVTKNEDPTNLADTIIYIIENHFSLLYIYDNSLLRFSEMLEKDKWIKEMLVILNNFEMVKRNEKLTKISFLIKSFRLFIVLKYEFIKSRFHVTSRICKFLFLKIEKEKLFF